MFALGPFRVNYAVEYLSNAFELQSTWYLVGSNLPNLLRTHTNHAHPPGKGERKERDWVFPFCLMRNYHNESFVRLVLSVAGSLIHSICHLSPCLLLSLSLSLPLYRDVLMLLFDCSRVATRNPSTEREAHYASTCALAAHRARTPDKYRIRTRNYLTFFYDCAADRIPVRWSAFVYKFRGGSSLRGDGNYLATVSFDRLTGPDGSSFDGGRHERAVVVVVVVWGV